jgi:hypothetical protein
MTNRSLARYTPDNSNYIVRGHAAGLVYYQKSIHSNV